MGMRSTNPIWRWLTHGTIIVIATLILYTPVLRVSGNTSFNNSSVSAAPLVNDLSHRYVVFLGGIRSFSPGRGSSPINNDLVRIKNQLRQLGIPDSNFVYFSYSAAYHHEGGGLYCSGWGKDGCSTETLGDLSSLTLAPVYAIEHTQLSVDSQAEALDWLIDQIIQQERKQGRLAQIDLISFSLGGIVATRWAAQDVIESQLLRQSSKLENYVHAVILINSPVGGIYPAKGMLEKRFEGIVWSAAIRWMFGEEVLRALQSPNDPDAYGSIVDTLEYAAQFDTKVLSIQSTTDFLVNGKNLVVTPFDFAGPVPIGEGTQRWTAAHIRYDTLNLGGRDVETVSAADLALNMSNNLLIRNHHAALTHPQTALWVMEAVKGDDQEQLPTLNPDGTICGQLQWATSCGEGLVRGQHYLFIPCGSHTPYVWQPLRGFSPNDYDRYFRVSNPVFETIEPAQCTNEHGYVTVKLASWSNYQPIDSCNVCGAPQLPAAIVKTSTLNVHTGPDISYNIIGTVQQGDALDIIGRTNDCSWLQVNTPAGQGWVSGSAQYVTLNVPCDSIPGVSPPIVIPLSGGFGPESVWGPSSDADAAVYRCLEQASDRQACLLDTMRRFSASPQAIALAERIGNNGYLADFQEMGRVDLGAITYPLAANSNFGNPILLNGVSPIIVVNDRIMGDELSGNLALQSDPVYPSLVNQFPDIMRDPVTSFETMQPLSAGGQRFIFRSLLVNGCRACEQVGTAHIALDFDETGNFLGTKLVSIEPLSLETSIPKPIHLIAPEDGATGGGQQTFQWNANFSPDTGLAFEVVFWKPGQDPMNSFSLASPTRGSSVTVNLDELDDCCLGELLDPGDYQWGVLLVRTSPYYQRIEFLGQTRTFRYSRTTLSPSQTAAAIVNIELLNIRAGPGLDYSILTLVQQPDALEVIGRNNDCSWLQIVMPTGAQGWVAAEFVTLNLPCDSIPVVSVSPSVDQPAPALPTNATPVAGEIRINPRDQAEYVFVPGGEFIMGSTIMREKMPVHTVEVDSFWIGRTEVTNAQYARCVEAGACTPPLNEDWQAVAKAEYPVANVNWSQAHTYALWVGGRLPTEAEWEKAARGTDGRIFPWADEVIDDQRLNFQFAEGSTVPVGSYPTGASPYGALDMAGNVEEWVADWYAPDYYAQSPRENPLGPATGSFRSVRGGSFMSSRGDVQTTARSTGLPDAQFDSVGFRVVVPGSTPEPAQEPGADSGDRSTVTPVQTFAPELGPVWDVAFSPNGATLAAATNSGLWVAQVDGETTAALATTNPLSSLSWAPNGLFLATGVGNRSDAQASMGWVYVWDLSSSTPILTLEGPEDAVLSVAWSPDGAFLAAGSADGRIYLWDVASGQLSTMLAGQEANVASLSWSADGSLLAAGGDDGVVHI